MAIHQDNNSRTFRTTNAWGAANYLTWFVRCDACNKAVPECEETAGDAADLARKHGFTTKILKASLPAEWRCPACKGK
jgi:hypothetical protein